MFTFCRVCGVEVPQGMRLCRDCKAISRERYKSPYKDEEPKHTFDGNKKLDADAVKAYQAGMTYGEYKMRMEQMKRGEITPEQLNEMIEKRKKKYEV